VKKVKCHFVILHFCLQFCPPLKKNFLTSLNRMGHLSKILLLHQTKTPPTTSLNYYSSLSSNIFSWFLPIESNLIAKLTKRFSAIKKCSIQNFRSLTFSENELAHSAECSTNAARQNEVRAGTQASGVDFIIFCEGLIAQRHGNVSCFKTR